MDPLNVVLPLVIGISSIGCGCSLPIFPGLFMIMRGSRSKARAIEMSALFSVVALAFLLFFGASISLFGLTLRPPQEGTVSQDSLVPLLPSVTPLSHILKFVGLSLYVIIGIFLLLNIEVEGKLSSFFMRKATTQPIGVGRAIVGSILYGVPATIMCSIIFLLPFVFSSLTFGDSFEVIVQFASFGIGRSAVIIIFGMLLSSLQTKALEVLTKWSSSISKIIGVIMIILGIYFYVYASASGF
ncbi:MAG: hypothetical protein NZ920_05350 [Aigarchaeota archaeon]|nr:hypothetical protein [Aigarchaeota archaeon]MDW8092878.1 hypothetical protein [Nitrososphaerota archaeon]